MMQLDNLLVIITNKNKGLTSSVVREFQEIVELCLKSMLLSLCNEPPKWHYAGSLLLEHRDLFK
jgi:HEPN domain-containing protein